MKHIYKRTLMQKCDLNKVASQLYWKHTSAWVVSRKFAAVFQNTFLQERIWRAPSKERKSFLRFNQLLTREKNCNFFKNALFLATQWLLFTVWKVSKYEVFSGLYFPVFGLNAKIYFVNLRIHSEYRKIRTSRNSVFGHLKNITN